MCPRFIWALSAPFLGVYAIVQNISIPVSGIYSFFWLYTYSGLDYITTTALWSARRAVVDSSEYIGKHETI